MSYQPPNSRQPQGYPPSYPQQPAQPQGYPPSYPQQPAQPRGYPPSYPQQPAQPPVYAPQRPSYPPQSYPPAAPSFTPPPYPQQYPPQQQPPPKKKHTLRNIFLVLIALIVIIAGIAVAASLYNASTSKTHTTTTPAATHSTHATSTAIPALTSPTLAPAETVIVNTLGANIIVNGNAEQGQCASDTSTAVTTFPGWTPKGNITPIEYAASGGDLDTTTAAPGDRGKCYFWGGPQLGSNDNTTTSMMQTIDISSLSGQSDAHPLTYQLSAWLGGYSSQDDNATILVQFLGASSNVLGSAKLGPVMATDRNGTSELLQRHSNGAVPAGTRTVTVTVTMVKTDGSDNDGLADDISLVMQPANIGIPTATP